MTKVNVEYSIKKAYEQNNPLISLARPILKALVQQTGESVAICIVDQLQRMCLASEESIHPIRYAIPERQHKELYADASGKVLLAFGTEKLRQQLLTKGILKKLRFFDTSRAQEC